MKREKDQVNKEVEPGQTGVETATRQRMIRGGSAQSVIRMGDEGAWTEEKRRVEVVDSGSRLRRRPVCDGASQVRKYDRGYLSW